MAPMVHHHVLLRHFPVLHAPLLLSSLEGHLPGAERSIVRIIFGCFLVHIVRWPAALIRPKRRRNERLNLQLDFLGVVIALILYSHYLDSLQLFDIFLYSAESVHNLFEAFGLIIVFLLYCLQLLRVQ